MGKPPLYFLHTVIARAFPLLAGFLHEREVACIAITSHLLHFHYWAVPRLKRLDSKVK
jgi:hypothetical protein